MQSRSDCRVVRIQRRDPELLRSLDRFHRALIQGSSTPPEQFMDFVAQRLGDETMLLILALVGDEPTGYALAFDVPEHAFMPEWQRVGYVTQFYVTPERRRQGVGQVMFDFIVRWLASRGIREVQLNVSPDNPVGNRFWRRQGFVPHRVRMKRMIG